MCKDLLKANEVVRLARALHALAHPLRYRMLCLLGAGEMNLQHIANAVHTSHSNAAQHLQLLETHQLVLIRRTPSRVYYRLNDQRTLSLLAVCHHILG
ncbi:MAG: metalloregulator ArsR/SmtB family transcription factor [Candidatus Igneacidithiobacillus chanchocoensis]